MLYTYNLKYTRFSVQCDRCGHVRTVLGWAKMPNRGIIGTAIPPPCPLMHVARHVSMEPEGQASGDYSTPKHAITSPVDGLCTAVGQIGE
jgi:hypothetical protein